MQWVKVSRGISPWKSEALSPIQLSTTQGGLRTQKGPADVGPAEVSHYYSGWKYPYGVVEETVVFHLYQEWGSTKTVFEIMKLNLL